MDWIPIDEWIRCAELERPGIVFELRNSEGQTLLARCGVDLPEVPFDWTSPPMAFRPVGEAPAVHSGPLPEPVKRDDP